MDGRGRTGSTWTEGTDEDGLEGRGRGMDGRDRAEPIFLSDESVRSGAVPSHPSDHKGVEPMRQVEAQDCISSPAGR